MAGSTINKTITAGVTLGSTGYASPLTITAAGEIAPTATVASALYADLGAGYVLNRGHIIGGIGLTGTPGSGNSGIGGGGTGGSGAYLKAGSLTTDGTIIGGVGGGGGAGSGGLGNGGAGGTGGSGVVLTAGSVSNNGAIIGGMGGGGGGGDLDGGAGGAGGIGAYVGAGSLTNEGTVAGGAGSAGTGSNSGGAGGRGGVGVDLVAGALVNDGVIFGGSGGAGGSGLIAASDGSGGVGARLQGGATLTNAGLIAGGTNASGGVGDAVDFGIGASRLILDPGATFDGVVFANAASSDVLDLASGSGAGTLSGLGTQFRDFAAVSVDSAAVWTLTGANTIAVGDTLADGGALTTDGSLGVYGMLAVYGALTNNGTIAASVGSTGTYASGSNFGLGGAGGSGGTAVTVSAASLTNSGTIAGGVGGTGGGANGTFSTGGGGGGGGAGVDLVSGGLTNNAVITGGAGGSGTGANGAGGAGGGGGVGVRVGGGSLTNTGTITGGGGGGGANGGLGGGAGGAGGAGIVVAGGTVVDDGSIMGGAGGSGGTGTLPGAARAGGVGALLQGGATLTVAGFIGGGSGAGGTAGAVDFGGGASRLILDPGATVSGAVVANTSYSDVLQLASASIAGTLSGLGGAQYSGLTQITIDSGAAWIFGGANTVAAGATLTNSGGLSNEGSLLVDGRLTNNGLISGSAGRAGAAGTKGSGFDGGAGGTGGAGVLIAGGILTNDGTITGGTGGKGGSGVGGGIGGAGGAGVDPVSGGAVNDGRIVGGAGGSGGMGAGGSAAGGGGGVGVQLPGGGTFTDAGFVGGGSGAGGIADAVYFGTGASRLILDPGFAFDGAVVANASYSNVLELAPSGGTLSGLSMQFTGFGRVTVDASAVWTLADANTIGTGVTLANSGTLSDTGTLTNDGRLTGGLSLAAGGVVYNAGGSTITHGSADAITGVGGPGTVVNYDFIGGSIANALGLLLVEGGTVTNQSGGSIHGYPAIYAQNGALTLVNAGSVTGNVTSSAGVKLGAGGSVTNEIGGVISAYRGVYTGHVAATVVNAGLISGNPIGGAGVKFDAGGSVTNQAGGTISGKRGVYGLGTADATGVVNLGVIAGDTTAGGYGVFLRRGGLVSNQASGAVVGSISGYRGIVGQVVAVTMVNQGIVSGGSAAGAMGVWLQEGGAVTNQAGGTIGGGIGVTISGAAGTVANAGAITGALGTAVALAGGFSNRAVLDPGASFGGIISGGNTIGATVASTLELAGGSGVGTLAGLGANYIDFARVLVDSGANWLLSGANTIAAGMTLSDAGTLTEAGALSNAGVIDGPVTLGSGGSLTNQSGGVLDGSGFAAVWGVAAGAATVVNDGRIDPAIYGIYLPGGGTITNVLGALIAGNAVGVKIGGGAGTVVNAGSIAGGAAAMVFGSGYANRLIIDPGASFGGSVNGGTTIGGTVASTLELASVASTGTLSGLGSAFQEFGSIVVDAGASWVLQGENEVANGTSLIGNGDALDISGGSAVVVLSGTGSLLDNAGELVVGDAATGELSIENGSTAISSPGTVAGVSGAVIANQTGAGGSSVNVTGADSDWQVGGALAVGNADSGVLAITNGASVSATTLDVGVDASGAGIVTVSGPDADLTTTGTVSVGDAGSGELSILDGANATIGGDLNVANTGTGTGNVDMEDTTGTITFGGNILVGFNGFGVFNVGFNVDYIQNNGGVIFGPDSSGAINSFADPSPFLSNSSPSPIAIGAQGVDQLAAYLFNSGEFTIPNNHSLTFDTPIISGGGSFALGSGDSMVLNADTVAGQTFTLGSNDKLTIGIDQLSTIDLPASGTGPFTPESNPNKGDLLLGNFGGVIANFSPGNTIDVDTYLSSASAGTLSQNGALVSVIKIANGDTLGVLRFDTAANATAVVADNAIVLEAAPCFAAGTRIATARGEVAVEAIGFGDRVQVLLGGGPTADGFAEVIWVGRRKVDCAGHAQPRKVWPVRVAAGAFGPGRPHTDVRLSPDHAIYLNDVLIPIKHLINGTTVAQVRVESITYHHIELSEHNVLLAAGLPAESFLDMRDGTKHANRAGPTRLYPDFSAGIWEAFGCARLVVAGPELVEARALVAGFAAERDAA